MLCSYIICLIVFRPLVYLKAKTFLEQLGDKNKSLIDAFIQQMFAWKAPVFPCSVEGFVCSALVAYFL